MIYSSFHFTKDRIKRICEKFVEFKNQIRSDQGNVDMIIIQINVLNNALKSLLDDEISEKIKAYQVRKLIIHILEHCKPHYPVQFLQIIYSFAKKLSPPQRTYYLQHIWDVLVKPHQIKHFINENVTSEYDYLRVFYSVNWALAKMTGTVNDFCRNVSGTGGVALVYGGGGGGGEVIFKTGPLSMVVIRSDEFDTCINNIKIYWFFYLYHRHICISMANFEKDLKWLEKFKKSTDFFEDDQSFWCYLTNQRLNVVQKRLNEMGEKIDEFPVYMRQKYIKQVKQFQKLTNKINKQCYDKKFDWVQKEINEAMMQDPLVEIIINPPHPVVDVVMDPAPH